MEENEPLPEHLRCKRTDGRQWRCSRRVMDDKKLCEIHHLQGRHRQYKRKVPESLKLQRKYQKKSTANADSLPHNVEIRAPKEERLSRLVKLGKPIKRKKLIGESEALGDAVKKMRLKRGDLQLELIRMVLRREVEKRKKKKKKKKKKVAVDEINSDNDSDIDSSNSEGDLMRDLPNGLMAISPAKHFSNAAAAAAASSSMPCDIKIGAADFSAVTRRCFRSKNIEPMPIGTLQVVPFKKDMLRLRRGKRKKCHLCRRSGLKTLIRCSSCRKQLYCMDCIKDQYSDMQEEVKIACPVCLGTCCCKACSAIQCRDIECKDSSKDKSKVNKVLHFHYLICMLLPVLKQLNQDQSIELEIEAKIKGQKPADVQIQQASVSCNKKCCWTKELEISAEEIIGWYELPETLDVFSRCSLCFGMDCEVNGIMQLQEAATRENSNDNFLYYPTVMDVHSDNLEHFQKHWGKGQPVIVRNVLPDTSDLSWDPIVMFCTYLKNNAAKSENEQAADCLDWFEKLVSSNCSWGLLRVQHIPTCGMKTKKLKGWLSSHLFQEHFPAHYAEILHALPLPEYMDPVSGVLNIAAELPEEIMKPELGPCVYISYGSGENIVQADSVAKLRYDSYDMVNILAHTTDVPVSSEQLNYIRKLMKKRKEQNEVSRAAPNDGQNVEEVGLHDMITEEMTSENMNFCGKNTDGSDHFRKQEVAEYCGAQWDVFRRQDIPKLVEYLRRHSNEFTHTYGLQKLVGHPILDQNFFLDTTHKMRLKEEFKIEPWTFEQHVGEAVIIPAGCPYQIRNLKSCVNVVLDFVSPENVTVCNQLIDEVRLLPENHNAKVDSLEVKKMTLHSISRAIKEIRELTCAETSADLNDRQ
ncbi:hypothetical protein GH714_001623 [Hevea brasiliensis]|uniref:JmjC domain-containing protein n=2 Tax=Hevea brasiliensis TaxID=3981 RepID=A0A6A6LX25_HEVBR|nr:hypothetical protein GH714_001623 [Hevea brasiliensis]